MLRGFHGDVDSVRLGVRGVNAEHGRLRAATVEAVIRLVWRTGGVTLAVALIAHTGTYVSHLV